MSSVSDVTLRGPLHVITHPRCLSLPSPASPTALRRLPLGPIREPCQATVFDAPILHGSIGATVLKCRWLGPGIPQAGSSSTDVAHDLQLFSPKTTRVAFILCLRPPGLISNPKFLAGPVIPAPMFHSADFFSASQLTPQGLLYHNISPYPHPAPTTENPDNGRRSPQGRRPCRWPRKDSLRRWRKPCLSARRSPALSPPHSRPGKKNTASITSKAREKTKYEQRHF